jgi:hypothetical protein
MAHFLFRDEQGAMLLGEQHIETTAVPRVGEPIALKNDLARHLLGEDSGSFTVDEVQWSAGEKGLEVKVDCHKRGT